MKHITIKINEIDYLVCHLDSGYTKGLWHSKMLSLAPKGKKLEPIKELDNLKEELNKTIASSWDNIYLFKIV